MESSNSKTIKGVVDSVSFRRESTGFTVLELESEGDLITVVGELPEIFAGEELTVTGTWQKHPSFGDQFHAEAFERRYPDNAAAILRYLSGGAIKGIGPATAARIVDIFGNDTLYVIEKEPLRLTQVKGISEEKANKISAAYKEQFGLSEAIAFLSRYSVTASEALAVWRRWGAAAQDMVESNPYYLCAPEFGIGYERVDAACAKLDRPADDHGRIAAGIKHVLRHNSDNGHTCIPRDKLCPTAAALLGQPVELVEEVLEEQVDYEELVEDELADRVFVFLPEYYYSETYCASRILMLMQYPPKPISNIQKQLEISESVSGITYEELQRKAITAAMETGFLILTGGPGTGKTTTLNAIIDILETCGQRVFIAAPTGRAAKRITEVTGHDAKTIHRLLEVQWGVNNIPVFMRNEKNPLECDALIVDELSMTDILLFEALLRAVRPHCRLIFVGDKNQLPSVGAGNVLADLISSGRVPVIHLKEIFRQASKSAIVTNAHMIVSGIMPDITRKDADFFFLKSAEPGVVAKTIEDLCYRRLPAAYDYSPLTDIQVLCPSRKGVTGTVELNKLLQQRLNPPDPLKHELKFPGVVFREGDKVMQIKNNYDVTWQSASGEEGSGVFNGDIGIIEKIDDLGGRITVRFEDRTAGYDIDEISQLEHAYAMTVHKSQGSEFTAVIIPMCPCPKQLMYRSLIYTAVTRAKSIIIMVGQPEILSDMIANKKRNARYTALAGFIKEQYSGSEDDG